MWYKLQNYYELFEIKINWFLCKNLFNLVYRILMEPFILRTTGYSQSSLFGYEFFRTLQTQFLQYLALYNEQVNLSFGEFRKL